MTARSIAMAALMAMTTVAAGAAGCGDDEGPPASKPCVPGSGVICTVAGTGIPGDGADDLVALETRLYLPQDVSIAPDGRLFIVDWNNHRIRARQADGTLHIVAGAGELGPDSDDPTTDRLNHPTQVTFDAAGNMVIAAWHNSRIKTVDLTTGAVLDVCGTGKRGFAGDGGPAATATLDLPVAVEFDPAGNLVIADQANDRLRRIDAATQTITTIAGVGPCTTPGACPALGDGGPATSAFVSLPQGQSARPGGRIDIDGAGNIYIADTLNARVRKIDTEGIITTVAGNGVVGSGGDGGPATDASLSGLADVEVAPNGDVYIADTANGCVRVMSAADGIIATVAGTCGAPGFAGDGGPATEAKLNKPGGIALDADGNLYIADTHNQRVRIVYR
jgi:sugar lactone lactonase YvrE